MTTSFLVQSLVKSQFLSTCRSHRMYALGGLRICPTMDLWEQRFPISSIFEYLLDYNAGLCLYDYSFHHYSPGNIYNHQSSLYPQVGLEHPFHLESSIFHLFRKGCRLRPSRRATSQDHAGSAEGPNLVVTTLISSSLPPKTVELLRGQHFPKGL